MSEELLRQMEDSLRLLYRLQMMVRGLLRDDELGASAIVHFPGG
jgi:hypothetical protein